MQDLVVLLESVLKLLYLALYYSSVGCKSNTQNW